MLPQHATASESFWIGPRRPASAGEPKLSESEAPATSESGNPIATSLRMQERKFKS